MLGLIFVLISLLIIFLIIKHFFWIGTLKSLTDKHVVITGGSTGIGRSVALECARRGAHVTILARNSSKLADAVNDIEKVCPNPSAQKIQHLVADVTNAESIERAIIAAEAHIPIYMLVNCAGMAIMGRLEDMLVEDIKYIINLNLLGTMYATRAAIGAMKERREGIVVITSSQAAMVGIFGCSAYSASKFALRGFAEVLNMENKPYNVTVTVALPPDTDTPGFANEEKTKPVETRLISEEGGLISPDDVGKQLVIDALRGRFYSYNVSLATLCLSTVGAGMSPVSSISELILQVLLMGPLRLVGAFYLSSFDKIVENCQEKRDKKNL